VAAAIADVIERPRAEVFTRPMFKQMQAGYYAAEDIETVEANPPFAPAQFA
jgi:hypothetical protein